MKIVIIGPGAMGSLLAGAISCRTGHEVWLLDHDARRAAALDQQIILEEGGNRMVCPLGISAHPEEIGQADFVFLCVKSKDVQTAIHAAGPLFKDKSLLIAFQNGIGHLSILEKVAKRLAVGIGVTAQGATLLAPGQVRHAGIGPTKIGLMPGKYAEQEQNAMPVNHQHSLLMAAAILTDAGIVAEVVDDITTHVWNKLVINVGINALTAIYNCANGALLDKEETRERLAKAVSEAAAVARHLGLPIMKDPIAATLEVCKATANNISSMLQDIRNKRPTEIDSINGAVVGAGQMAGIEVSENERLVRQIKEIEAGYVKNSA